MNDADRQFQFDLLQGVARTFALTIPQLPPALVDIIANAYLLCRIADTIEDEAAIAIPQKCELANQFIEIIAGNTDTEAFVLQFSALLSEQRLPAEKLLIRQTSRVIAITHGFTTRQQAILLRCVRMMSRGMVYYQAHSSASGLETHRQLDNYCYHVAGVVGEMLTELWCDYSPVISKSRERLMVLAVSFGQGLQLTNIVKDIWEDLDRGVCWLPRDVFGEAGFDLDHLLERHKSTEFASGLEHLIGITRAHLNNATEYLSLIPTSEPGLRKFCLWAIAMALLTLNNIHRNLGFSAETQVKINKACVLEVIFVSKLVHRSHRLTNLALKKWGRGLPCAGNVSTDTSHTDIERWFEQ